MVLVAQITYYHVSHIDKYDLSRRGIVDSTSIQEKLSINHGYFRT